MAEIGKYKLSDALGQHLRMAGGEKGCRPLPTHETAAEQAREANESEEARGGRGVEPRPDGGCRVG